MNSAWGLGAVDAWPARLRATLRQHFAPPTVVLLYHRVLPVIGRDVNQLAITTENLAAHLAWLAAHAHPLRPAEFVASLHRSPATQLTLDGGKPRVLLTFDDGYADNFHHALPLLVEHGLSAIVYPVTGMVGSDRPFWWDALEQIVCAGSRTASGWRLPDGALVPGYPDRTATYRILHSALKSLADDARQTALAGLAEQAHATPAASDDSRSMNWRELRAWLAAGLQVGGHTRTHAQLSALHADELADEIAGCKQELQRRLGTAVETFAYPFGTRDDFGGSSLEAVRAAGFRCALANRPGHVRWARDRFALPRYLVRNWTVDELATRLQAWCRG